MRGGSTRARVSPMSRGSQTDALRAHDGTGETIADLPVVANGTFEDQWVSTADLDHDGRADLIVGDRALRCPG
jgi:hypothetical protein